MMRAIQFAVVCVVLSVATVGNAEAGVLTTTFVGGNGQDGNMFDVVVGPNALTITSVDMNISTTSPVTMEMWYRSGTWVGFQNSSASWTLHDTVTVPAPGGSGFATNVDFTDLVLAPSGVTALYLTGNPGSVSYTNGSGVGNIAASNADLSILEGAGKSYPFSSTFTPRIWNGTIYYDVGGSNAIPEPTSLALLATGAFGFVGYSWRRKRKLAA